MAGRNLRNLKSDQSGSALIFSLLIGSLLMVAALAIMTVTNDDFRLTSSRSELSKAKYVADGAVEVIKQQIIASEKKNEIFSVPSEKTGSIAGGSYRYTVTPRGDSEPYTIRVWASVELPNGEIVKKNIKVKYNYKPDPGPGGGGTGITARKALEYTLFQGGGLGTLHLNAESFTGKGQVYSRSKVQLFEDNPRSNPLIFEGTVTSLKEVQPIGTISSQITRKPFDIDIPTPLIDWDYLYRIKTIDGNNRLAPNRVLDLNNVVIKDKDVIYVDGDMTLVGNLSFDALIVATGNITVIGDFSYPDSDYKTAGIIAGKDLILKAEDTIPKKDTEKGPTIRGLGMAGEYVVINGDVNFTGSLIASRDITFTSGILNYDTTGENPVEQVILNFGQQIFSNY